MTTMQVPTPDGRELEVLVEGDEDGFPFFLHSGSPTAAVAYPPYDRAARERGLRLITCSRPGYGASSPRTGDHVVADDVTDVVTVLDAVGASEFVTLGHSGGGPRALACAALLPGRCLAATSLAGVAPRDAAGLDWPAGMAEENQAEYAAAAAGHAAYDAHLTAEALPMLTAPAAELAEALGGLLTDVDRASLDPSYAAYLAEVFHRAAEQGVVGMRDDGLVMMQPWGFDLAAVRVPVAVWQGDLDAMVPPAHGRWLAEHVAGARAHLLPDEGHLSITARMGEMLDELVAMAGLR